jgi:hypothetical protein
MGPHARLLVAADLKELDQSVNIIAGYDPRAYPVREAWSPLGADDLQDWSPDQLVCDLYHGTRDEVGKPPTQHENEYLGTVRVTNVWVPTAKLDERRSELYDPSTNRFGAFKYIIMSGVSCRLDGDTLVCGGSKEYPDNLTADIRNTRYR